MLSECNHDSELAKEAMFILTNALTSCSKEVLLDVWDDYNESLAFKLLNYYQNKANYKSDDRLLSMLLTTFEALLDV